MTEDKDPNIVEIILNACKNAGLDSALASKIEREICEQYGGRRVYIAKRKRISEEGRRQVFNDGLSAKPTEQIIQEHGISRATLYRMMKKSLS